MSVNATQAYKRSLSGSVGAGMKSMMGGNDRRFYVLEHKVSSKYHKAGESQKIIIDEIELGRDPKCQVRFDENFATVSKRHAAIVKDGENWKLIQLSKTNSTYLNGQKITTEWYLQSGDEIQLSTNGPKLGFIVPQGDKGLVKSIGLTARMSLFRQQALLPYKKAIVALACVLVVLCVAGGFFITHLSGRVSEAEYRAQRSEQQIEAIKDSSAAQIASITGKINDADSINAALRKQIDHFENRNFGGGKANTTPPPSTLKAYSEDVYWMHAYKVEIEYDGRREVVPDFSWIATGFLLDDGTFATARHCVEGWRYPQGDEADKMQAITLCVLEDQGVKVTAYIKAYSNKGDILEFNSHDFVTNNATDEPQNMNFTDEYGQVQNLPYKVASLDGTDFAYARTNKRGSLKFDCALSKQLPQGTTLFVLGYPYGLGAGTDVNDIKKIQPSYSECVVARSGLTPDGRIQLSGRGYESGNSGGPVFVAQNGEYKVVGIVSSGKESIGFLSPICRIKNQ